MAVDQSALRRVAGTMADADAAALLGISRQEVLDFRVANQVKRFKGSLGAPTPSDAAATPKRVLRRKGADGPVEELIVDAPPAITDAPAAPPSGRKKSATALLEGVRGKLGKVPDDVVGDEVGLSRGVVGAFRRKHGIPAYDGYLFEKGHPPVAAKGDRPKKAPPKRSRGFAPAVSEAPPEPAVTGGRKSATTLLERVRDKLGKVPDDVIGVEVGLSRGVVGAFRRKHAIEAYDGYLFVKGEGPGKQPSTKVDGPTPSRAQAPPKPPTPAAARPSVPAPNRPPTVQPFVEATAYRVQAASGERRLEFIAVGKDAAAACGRADAWLSERRDGPWSIDDVLRVGTATL